MSILCAVPWRKYDFGREAEQRVSEQEKETSESAGRLGDFEKIEDES